MQNQVQDQVNTAQDYTERLLNNAIDGLPTFVGALVILIIRQGCGNSFAHCGDEHRNVYDP